MSEFNIVLEQVNEINASKSCTLEGLLEKCNVLFNGELGKFEHARIHLKLKPNAVPVFFKPRTVPYAFRTDIAKELARLEKLIIT